MNLRIPLQVVDSTCVAGIMDAEEQQLAGTRVSPPLTSLTPVVGQKLSVLPHWSQLPTADGGAALKIMKAAMKLSHVVWQMEVPALTLEAERKRKMSHVVELELPKKPQTDEEKKEEAKIKLQQCAWTLLPSHALPFPWDGQELQPVSEQVGLLVRPIATFVDREEGNPIDGLPTSIGPSFTVSFSSKMKTTLQKIRRDGRIGFHATSAENSDRYAIFVGFHSPGADSNSSGDASESGSADDTSDVGSTGGGGSPAGAKKKSRGKLHFAAQLIPDNDAAPLQTVKEGTLGAAAGLLPVVQLSTSDEVAITLHLQTLGGSSSGKSRSAEEEKKGAAHASPTFQTAAPFELCLRSRLDRDLITAAILVLQGDSIEFAESMERRLQLELLSAKEEEEPRTPFRRRDYVVCRVQDAMG